MLFHSWQFPKARKEVPSLSRYYKIKDGVGVGVGASVSARARTPSGSNPRGTIILNLYFILY